MFILTDLSIHWYIFSSDTGYSFGLDFIFLATFLICFLFIAAFTFLCFITASFLIFSLSFWSSSFFAFSCSILFIAGLLEAAYSLNWGAREIWGKGGGETLALL